MAGPPEAAGRARSRGDDADDGGRDAGVGAAVVLPGPETAVFWPLSALRAHTKAP
jgi:hypothetical protein